VVTLVITAKVDTEVLAADKAVTLTNKAILTGNDYLPAGGVSATGDVTIPATGSQLLTKSQANTETPAYVQFALDINTYALDLVADDGDLDVDDVMGEGMSLAIRHTDYVKVYEIAKDADIYKANGTVDIDKVKSVGTPITDRCSWTKIETDTDNPTYRFTVPDGKHVVITYWASFTGVTGQTVSLSNTAYFYYEGIEHHIDSGEWSDALRVGAAGGSGYSNPFFYLQKLDQWGNNVSGAVFEVDEYDATNNTWTEVATRTTEDGLAYIGHESDNDSFTTLKSNTIYRIVEVKAPTGYALDTTEHYFEFADLTNGVEDAEVTDETIKAHEATHPAQYAVVDLPVGGTYTVTNRFTGASWQIPVAKTINGENLESTVEFSFTLKQTANANGKTVTVYTDGNYRVPLMSEGLTATIAGAGSTLFDAIYFKEAGEYRFTLTEDALSQDAKNRGYTEAGKDNTTYTVTVVVGAASDGKSLTVESITYEGGSKSGDIVEGNKPTFDNKLSLTGELNLQVKKVVTGRSAAVAAGEFSFQVLKDGKVIKDSDGNALVFTTQAGGLVDITIPITQDDIGEQDFVIQEVVPDNAPEYIEYTASAVIATVTIGEVDGGVAPTSKVSYTAKKFENGVPLMTNTYKATGSLTLTGTKQLVYYANHDETKTVRAGQFSFVVKEDHTQVATGTTLAGGEIEFTTINYLASDAGEHVYTISEVAGSESFVNYSDKTVTVTVMVSDDGQGHLTPAVTKVDDEAVTDSYDITFVNEYTLKVPTGIRLNTAPFVIMFALAASLAGGMMITRRRRRRG
jgi:pilin isopeptide linkage protein